MTGTNIEIKQMLKEALQHIQMKNYAEARCLLQNCTEHPLGRKWLNHFDTVAANSTRISSNLQSNTNS